MTKRTGMARMAEVYVLTCKEKYMFQVEVHKS